MAFSGASRRCRLLVLELAFFCSLPHYCFAAVLDGQPATSVLSRQALDHFFGVGMGGELSVPVPSAVQPRPVAAAVSFNGLQVPSYIFSRGERISKTLISIIDKTQKRMDLALYILNLPDVAQAIVRAKKERGVDVRVIIDQGHAFPTNGAARSKELDLLINSGVSVRTLRGMSQYGIMHNKFGLYDDKLLSAGSFNWTVAADLRNFENALFRDQPEFLAAFQDYWDWMWAKATPLSGLSVPGEDRGIPRDGKPSLSFKGQPWPSFSFSPQGGTTDLIVKAIDLCGKRLDIAMFSFFSEDIGRAVVRAKERGVIVRIVMDRGQGRNTSLKKLFSDNGIDFKFSDGVGGLGVLHHKFGLFDEEMVETGSFNYSNNAELNNYENAVFSTRGEDVGGFSGEFEFLYGQAAPPSLEDLAAPIASPVR